MSLIMTIYNQPLGIMDIIFKPPADLGISKQLIGSQDENVAENGSLVDLNNKL